MNLDEDAKKAAVIITGVIVALAAAFFYLRKKHTTKDEKPSKRAPQLNIVNPGTQDDFPSPPAVSGIG